MFAAAKSHGFFFGDIHFFRRKGGTLVRTVAERLAPGLATSAPKVAAGFYCEHKGRPLRDMWFTHVTFVTALLLFANLFCFWHTFESMPTDGGGAEQRGPVWSLTESARSPLSVAAANSPNYFQTPN
jgi:hypothetical protein